MRSRSKHLYSLCFNNCRLDCKNGFCTATVAHPVQSQTLDESPELPEWVRISVKEKQDDDDDDDFVPPSVSYWIDNHKFRVHDVDVKNIVNDILESDADRISKILKKQFKSPNLVVEALHECVVDVSDSLVEQMLRRFSCEWMPAFGFFTWAELHKGMKHSPYLYNLMIDNLGKTKKFDIMWQLIDQMKNLKGYVTLDTMTKIMRRLAKAAKYDDAVNVFEKFETFGVEKDVIAMNRLMDALVKQGSVEHAEVVFLAFKQRIPPDLHTYNLLVHGWCKTRQIDKAKRTVDEMKEHGFYPDSITYTYFIEAYSREKDFRRVNATMDEMKQNGCHPTVVTYTIILNALAKAKETNKAMEIYEKMKEDNCAPDAAFYNVFITALSRAGRLKDCDDVFEDMSKNGISPVVSTYNTLIFLAAHNSQEEKALKLLAQMEENGCKPDLNTYSPLLKMCCRLKRTKVLSFLLIHMFKNDVSLDLGTYSLLVSRLSRNGRLDQACSFFKESVVKGFVPMDCTYDNLIKQLQMKGMHNEMQQIQELMSLAKKRDSGLEMEKHNEKSCNNVN